MDSKGDKWDANATLVVRDVMGKVLSDGDEVTFRIIIVKRKKDGTFETKTETKEEKVSGGVVGIKEKDLKSDKESEPEISVSFEVVSVKQDKNTPASGLWDNAKPSITVKMP